MLTATPPTPVFDGTILVLCWKSWQPSWKMAAKETSKLSLSYKFGFYYLYVYSLITYTWSLLTCRAIYTTNVCSYKVSYLQHHQ